MRKAEKEDRQERGARPRTDRGRAGGGAVDPALAAEIADVARAAGCQLVHVEWKGNTLRVYIDREGPDGQPGGVSLGDCEHVSRQVSAVLDVADYGTGRYLLEVSSPGLDRQLYGPRDYARFLGRLARVTYEDPAAGIRKRTVVARLAAFHGEPAPGHVELADAKTGEVTAIDLDNIKTARLEIELG